MGYPLLASGRFYTSVHHRVVSCRPALSWIRQTQCEANRFILRFHGIPLGLDSWYTKLCIPWHRTIIPIPDHWWCCTRIGCQIQYARSWWNQWSRRTAHMPCRLCDWPQKEIAFVHFVSSFVGTQFWVSAQSNRYLHCIRTKLLNFSVKFCASLIPFSWPINTKLRHQSIGR